MTFQKKKNTKPIWISLSYYTYRVHGKDGYGSEVVPILGQLAREHVFSNPDTTTVTCDIPLLFPVTLNNHHLFWWWHGVMH